MPSHPQDDSNQYSYQDSASYTGKQEEESVVNEGDTIRDHLLEAVSGLSELEFKFVAESLNQLGEMIRHSVPPYTKGTLETLPQRKSKWVSQTRWRGLDYGEVYFWETEEDKKEEIIEQVNTTVKQARRFVHHYTRSPGDGYKSQAEAEDAYTV
ncbi:hypothetical protein M231_03440 [Tremella mesenterica]|uniref:Uncharacterized protein n=1 Tax=Tremella mesenterica TaxID=5217 RepID=A0A4Q1BN84_TREME|nr:hypothetical protein M231_03440 [Tremella mesenterica]